MFSARPLETQGIRMAPRTRAPQSRYAAIMGTFIAGLAGAGVLARALAATRRNTSPSTSRRAGRRGEPHRDGRPSSPPPPPQAIGELVTCSRCVGTWIAADSTTTQVVALPS